MNIVNMIEMMALLQKKTKVWEERKIAARACNHVIAAVLFATKGQNQAAIVAM